VSAHAGGRQVHLLGWCLGGIFSLLTVAARSRLPVASITAIASPVDVTAVPLVAPLRPLLELGAGRLVTTAHRALGGAPATWGCSPAVVPGPRPGSTSTASWRRTTASRVGAGAPPQPRREAGDGPARRESTGRGVDGAGGDA
jgi:hypothetical protein